MRHLLLSINHTDLIQRIDTGTKPPMHRKDFILDNGTEREIVKDFRAVPPHIHRTVFPQTLIVKPVDLRNLPTFVIAADEGDAIGVADFES
jgi:hypothetical protein